VFKFRNKFHNSIKTSKNSVWTGKRLATVCRNRQLIKYHRGSFNFVAVNVIGRSLIQTHTRKTDVGIYLSPK